MSKAKPSYGNESISSLKGADRVRKRPGVIFGSDGLEGCEHAVFEILSNSIDEAREGHGTEIITTRYADGSIEVADHGRGIPIEWNENEQRYNWELVFCELYAGGKYKNDTGENYEFSLGLNGLGTCATQYSSEYMDVTVIRDGFEYGLHFEKGENKTGTKEGYTKKATNARKTGTTIRWKPDLEVFTDINIPVDYYLDTLKRQAVVNSHIKFVLKNQVGSRYETTEFLYQNGIVDYVTELAGENPLTSVQFLEGERRGRDRADKAEYKVKLSCAFCFSSAVSQIEYYHNSSWLEHGGAPDKAVRSAFVSAIDAYLKQNNKYNKSESKVTYQDIFDSLVLVTNCFSTQTSYENQTKKAITNKFIQEAMTEFLKEGLEIYFIENKAEADKIAEQILINKRSREQAEKARLNIKKKLSGNIDLANRVQKFVDCRTKDASRRELYIVEGDSALGSVKQGRDSEFQAIMPVRGKILNCLKADYDKIFKNDNQFYKHVPAYLFLLNTGIRCGEAIALEWSDIDFENRICRINKNFTLVKSRDKNWNAGKRQKLVSETKTAAGVREIPLNDRAVEMLEQIQKYNRKRGIETPYVISTDSGAQISERSLFQSLEYALGAAEIHHIGLHGLRHTFASTLLRKGVDIAVVSKLLGHRNVTTTFNTYIHIIEEQKRNAIKAIPSI